MARKIETYIKLRPEHSALVVLIDGLESMFFSSGSVVDDIRDAQLRAATAGGGTASPQAPKSAQAQPTTSLSQQAS